MQPSARPVYPRACRPRSTCSSGRACRPHACCACTLSCARKAIPRHSAVGPLSSKSTVLTLLRLRRRLTPAQTVPVCLWCPSLPDKSRFATLVVGPLTSECYRVHCMDAAAVQLPLPHQLSKLTGSLLLEDFKSPTLYHSVFNRLQQLARADRRPAAESAHNMTLQLNCLSLAGPVGSNFADG